MKINNKGAVLPYVMVIMVIFTLLGVVLLQSSTFTSQSMRFYRRNMQAYDAAWSGAVAMGNYIAFNPDEVDTLVANSPSNPYEVGVGSFQVSLSKDGDFVDIESIGTVVDKEETLHLIMKKSMTGWINFGIFSRGPITLRNTAAFIGDVGTNSEYAGPWINIDSPNASISGDAFFYNDTTGSIEGDEYSDNKGGLSGDLYANKKPMTFPPKEPDYSSYADAASAFPDGDIYPSNSGNPSAPLYTMPDYLTISSDTTLLFPDGLLINQGSGIIVDEDVTVNIFIDGSFNMNGSSSDTNSAFIGAEIDGDDNPICNPNINIFYYGTDPFDLDFAYLDASIYIVNDTIFTISNPSTIIGNIITNSSDDIIINNSSSITGLIWAPNSDVTFSNGAVLEGALIANTVDFLQSSSLIFNPDVATQDNLIFDYGIDTYVVDRWE